MNRQSLRLRLFPVFVMTAASAWGCSHASSNNLNGGATRQTIAPQARAMPPANVQPVQQTAPVGDNTPVYNVPPLTPASMPVPTNETPAQVVQRDDTAAAGPERIVVDTTGTVQDVDRRTLGAEDSFHDRQDPAPRRSFVDITALPCFNHAPDYRWLAGQLHYSKSENCWRLRYASLDENDRYDGEVTLVDYPPLDYLKDGQCVRVNGEMVAGDGKEQFTSYKVTSMHPVQEPSQTIAAQPAGEYKTTPTSQEAPKP